MLKIAVTNEKGGVGKTDLCVNLSSSLALKGKKILVVDLDPQANATDYLTTTKPKLSTSEVLLNDNVQIEDIALRTEIDNLFLAPASPRLSAAQVQLVNDVGMQFKLKKKLEKVRSFDYVFIDTPPSLGLLTINALTAADKALIPVQVHYFPLEGVVKVVNTIKTIREEINPNLEILGFALTMFDKRTKLSFEIEKMVRESFRERVFKTKIPINIRLAEAPSHHKPVLLYDRSCRGTRAYQELAKEFLQWLK